MTIGLILLIIVGLLVLFGVGQRVLDKLRLTDRQALLFIALLIAGGWIPDLPLGEMVRINVGGALIPLILCGYLLAKAGTAMERMRAVLAAVTTGAAVFALGHFLPNEPESMWFDPNYLYGLVGGAIAYLFGRSRRGAFIAGVLGVMLADAAQAVILWTDGVAQPLRLGSAGAMDVVVISGLLAVLLAELVGELIERATRGNRRDRERAFEGGAFVPRKERDK